jgi:hypothetical protein
MQPNLLTDALCSTLSWWQLVAVYWNSEVCETGSDGCAHARELEASMYFHLDPDGVREERVREAQPHYVRQIRDGETWEWTDLTVVAGLPASSGGPPATRRLTRLAPKSWRRPRRAGWPANMQSISSSRSYAGCEIDLWSRGASIRPHP